MVPKINSSLRIVTFSIMHIQCASARVPCSYFYRNVKERLIEQDFKKVELSFFCLQIDSFTLHQSTFYSPHILY
jgi:hypothetical protein